MSNPHEQHTYHITVNGKKRPVHQGTLTFHEVCVLAFPDGPFNDNIVYTVTYSYRGGPDLQLAKGGTVEVRDGMLFVVGNTDRS